MRIFGIGIDLVEVGRIEDAIQSHGDSFLNRVFTKAEQEYCLGLADSNPSFAGRFAAKEAVSKAFATGIGKSAKLTDIEVVREPSGAPIISLSGSAHEFAEREGITRVLISISHTKKSAVAQAMAIMDS